MATRKVTITLDEDLYNEIRQCTDNLSAAMNNGARWWLALERQRRLVSELDDELSAQRMQPDSDEEQRARTFFRELTEAAAGANADRPR